MIRNVCLILICFQLSGCTSLARNRKMETRVNELEASLRQQQQIILHGQQALEQGNTEIVKLQAALAEKEKLLKEKDDKIAQLRKRLEGFGVFE